MTSKKYRSLLGDSRASRRKTETRSIKKMFIIITEGETEAAYFHQDIFQPQLHSAANVRIICKKSRQGTDPRSVLAAMKDEITTLQKKKNYVQVTRHGLSLMQTILMPLSFLNLTYGYLNVLTDL